MDKIVSDETPSNIEDEKQNESQMKPYLTYNEVVENQTERANEYHKIGVRIEIISSVLTLVILGLLIWLRIPNFLRDISPFGSEYSFLTVGFVVSIFFLIDFIISLPISYYNETIERQFEFATRSNKDWSKDKFKELLLSIIIGLVIMEALFAALHFQPQYWWFIAFLGYFVFAAVLSSLSPFLIALFTDIKPMEDGEIRKTVENIAKKMYLEYDDIYTWNMSEQTTKANAAVVGFGKTIRIMIGDTLMSHFRPDEIEVVMAHEIAHQQQNHVYKGILFNGIIALVAFYLIDLSFDFAIINFDIHGKSDPAMIGYLWFSLLIILELLGKISLWFGRRLEKEADMVAIKELKNLEIFESAFARLGKQNLSYPNPSKFEILWRYSHPPIKERIRYATEFIKS